MSGGPQFAPNTNTAQGSPISAALLNGLVQAQGYVQSGGAPPTSASLVVTMPATQAVVPIVGGLSVWVSMASGALPALPASNDSYIDLVATTSYPYTGSYVVSSVANGAMAPAVAANGLRLCKVVTSGTAATAVTALAPLQPLGQRAPTVLHQLATADVSLATAASWTNLTGESYSITTLQPGSRVFVSHQFLAQNTSNLDGRFDLQLTTAPAGSGYTVGQSITKLDATHNGGFGLIKAGQGYEMVDVQLVFDAPLAGTYTLQVVYATTVGTLLSGAIKYNISGNFSNSATNNSGFLQLAEVLG